MNREAQESAIAGTMHCIQLTIRDQTKERAREPTPSFSWHCKTPQQLGCTLSIPVVYVVKSRFQIERKGDNCKGRRKQGKIRERVRERTAAWNSNRGDRGRMIYVRAVVACYCHNRCLNCCPCPRSFVILPSCLPALFSFSFLFFVPRSLFFLPRLLQLQTIPELRPLYFFFWSSIQATSKRYKLCTRPIR